jgi:hypothetical protein
MRETKIDIRSGNLNPIEEEPSKPSNSITAASQEDRFGVVA